MKGLYSFALVAALVLAACGGSADESSTTTTAAAGGAATTTTQMPASEANDTEETTSTVAVQALSDGNEDTTFFGNSPGTGTVEIGDLKYEFDLNILCLSMAGAMGVAGQASDGSDATVDADFPPEGWETSNEGWEAPSISIDDEERDIRWEAGGVAAEMHPEANSQIETFTADGHLAVGETAFVNTYTFGEDLQVEQGRFEFNCPE